jgi:membrane protein DedA with SNARE-associated domain
METLADEVLRDLEVVSLEAPLPVEAPAFLRREDGMARFERHGGLSVVVGRLLPVVRTYISLPAGIARMPFGRFVLYSTIGSVPWTIALLLAGRALGSHWQSIAHTVRHVDAALVAAVVIAAVVALWLSRRRRA